jgi:nanoRNase/pAp phosphatase (c-di-AMP/oligoRNAs hydrolase)
MATRLVLGSGTLANALVGTLSDRPGGVVVAGEDEGAVWTLREEGVSAEVVDFGDPASLRAAASEPDTVAVATETRSLAVARSAREAFPDAYILACGGIDADLPPEIEAVADDVSRPLESTTGFLMDRAGDGGVRTRKLMRVLRGLDGPLAVVTHDNPDPDAIASAVALERIAATAGCDAEVCYYGAITHQENRALVNLLEFDLVNLGPDADLSNYGGFALVDHSRPGVNDGLPENLAVDIVIDHHPPRAPVEARFVDLRSEVGATSTLLVDYLGDLNMVPDVDVATGLLFGVRVDTDEFTREVSSRDFEATAFLQPHADLGTLERVESPKMSADTVETVARAIRNRQRHGSVLTSGVEALPDRDALAQAADRLLGLEDVTTTFVYGFSDGTIYVSARTRGTDVDLGETLRSAFGRIGSAGGHADMAGAQIPLGLLDAVDGGDESVADVVDTVLTDRFLSALDSRTHRVIRDVYPRDFHGVDDLRASGGRASSDSPDDPGVSGDADDG